MMEPAWIYAVDGDFPLPLRQRAEAVKYKNNKMEKRGFSKRKPRLHTHMPVYSMSW